MAAIKTFVQQAFSRRALQKEEKGKLTEAYAQHLKSLILQASEKDRDLQVFGAKKHKYRLNPVLSLRQVQEFEQKYHLRLPEEYIFFLTKVGNGGAGPYYGLYSLEQVARNTEKLDCYTQEDLTGCPAVIDKNLTKERWAELVVIDEEEEVCTNKAAQEKADALWEEMMRQVSSGALVIGTQGCTYDHLLMWKGTEQGKIVCIDWNLDPEGPPFLTGLSFLEWYEAFFQGIVSGQDMTSFGYISLKSEEELIADFMQAQTADKRQKAIAGFYKFKQVSQETVDFLAKLKAPEVKLNAARTELLMRFSLETGLLAFQSLLAEDPNAAVLCARKMPKDRKDAFYPAMLSLLYRPDIQEKSRLCYFLSDCSCCLAKDLAAFAADEKNTKEERRSAIYVMGLCPDKQDYLDGVMH